MDYLKADTWDELLPDEMSCKADWGSKLEKHYLKIVTIHVQYGEDAGLPSGSSPHI